MKELFLVLYSRNGCCLCEGLEQKLRKLAFNELNPPAELVVIDIDDVQTSLRDRDRYDLRVPVIAIKSPEFNQTIELPRISPRLKGEALFTWLQKSISKVVNSIENKP